MTPTVPFIARRDSQEPWQLLADGAMTGGAVTFGDARIPPQSSGPSLHVHEREDEAAYVIQGLMTFRVGNDMFEAGPGTLVWLPRNVPHTFANLSDEPVWAFGTTIPAGLEGMFVEQAKYFDSLSGPPDERTIDEIGAKYGVRRLGPPLSPDTG